MHPDPEEGEALVTGDVVNTAARLQAAAAPGGCSSARGTALAVASAVELEDAGALALKGKADPVPAFRALVALAEPERDRAMGAPPCSDDRAGRRARAAAFRARGVRLGEAPPRHARRAAGNRQVARAARARAARAARRRGGSGRTGEAGRARRVPSGRGARLCRPRGCKVGPERARRVGGSARGAARRGARERRRLRAGRARRRVRRRGDGRRGRRAMDRPLRRMVGGLEALGDGPELLARRGRAGPHPTFSRSCVPPSPMDPRRAGVSSSARRGPRFSRPSPTGSPARSARRSRAALPAGPRVRSFAHLVADALSEELVRDLAERSGGDPLFVEELLRSWVGSGLLEPAASGWRLRARGPGRAACRRCRASTPRSSTISRPLSRALVRKPRSRGGASPWARSKASGSPGAGLGPLERRGVVHGPMPRSRARRHRTRSDTRSCATWGTRASPGRSARLLHVRMARWLEGVAGSRAARGRGGRRAPLCSGARVRSRPRRDRRRGARSRGRRHARGDVVRAGRRGGPRRVGARLGAHAVRAVARVDGTGSRARSGAPARRSLARRRVHIGHGRRAAGGRGGAGAAPRLRPGVGDVGPGPLRGRARSRARRCDLRAAAPVRGRGGARRGRASGARRPRRRGDRAGPRPTSGVPR